MGNFHQSLSNEFFCKKKEKMQSLFLMSFVTFVYFWELKEKKK